MPFIFKLRLTRLGCGWIVRLPYFWIQNNNEWKQFVQHRVNEILTLTKKDVSGVENPADIGSRGGSLLNSWSVANCSGQDLNG